MMDAPVSSKRPVPWRGRPRVVDPMTRSFPIRFSERQLTVLREAANRAGLSVAGFLRVKAFDEPAPRSARRPPVEVREIARLYGEIGKLGSNVNQLAHHANATRALPTVNELRAMNFYLMEMHDALMRALGREP